MPIDTRNERAGALNVALPFGRVFDNPDNAFNQADRQQSTYAFPGILAASSAPGQPITKRTGGIQFIGCGLFGPRVS